MKTPDQIELLGKGTPVAPAPVLGCDPVSAVARALYRIRNPYASVPLDGPWSDAHRRYWIEAGVIVAELQKDKLLR